MRLDGPDRRSFLQGLLTNDIEALAPGSSCYAAWLTPQGRMIADMHVLETGDFLLLDVARDQAPSLAQRLDQSIFTEQVTVRDASSEYRRIALAGPQARLALEEVLRCDPRANACHFLDPAWEVPFFELFIDAASGELCEDAIRAIGVVDVGRAEVEALRIESGIPLFGVDMDEHTIPLEAGIEARAISFTKGCYVGQEVVIRVLHRGHGRVAKKLVRLAVDVASEADLPPRGTPIVKEGHEIGTLTSVAWSPTLGKGVALGYVQREFTESAESFATPDGTALAIRAPGATR